MFLNALQWRQPWSYISLDFSMRVPLSCVEYTKHCHGRRSNALNLPSLLAHSFRAVAFHLFLIARPSKLVERLISSLCVRVLRMLLIFQCVGVDLNGNWVKLINTVAQRYICPVNSRMHNRLAVCCYYYKKCSALFSDSSGIYFNQRCKKVLIQNMLIFPKFSPLKKIDFAHILTCEKGILHNLRFLFELQTFVIACTRFNLLLTMLS